MMDLAHLFEQHKDEFLKLDRIENPRHERSDLCAFLLLHELAPVPPTRGDGFMVRRMVSAAGHDEMWRSLLRLGRRVVHVRVSRLTERYRSASIVDSVLDARLLAPQQRSAH